MNLPVFTDPPPHLPLWRKLYRFFRQEWDIPRVTALKALLRSAPCGAGEAPDDGATDRPEAALRTALTLVDEIGLKQPAVCASLLSQLPSSVAPPPDEVRRLFGSETANILRGLRSVSRFGDKPAAAAAAENHIRLLLSEAGDLRVIFILIARRLQQMRDAKDDLPVRRAALAEESASLYAPLAHRLGLYTVKSELEDLSLKYTDRARYDFIARKLNETKRSRDRYISEFIAPVKERLDKAGLKCDIKGRTKSIHSIRNKLAKQQIEFENIYDLFAIRIILDAPPDREKALCWQTYSIVTDMYQPNPARLKDWLSIPKSNGYESLHTTVLGPGARWVEVQIRTKRMDEVAERGLAAHWKYKGVKPEAALDAWLSSLRAPSVAGGDDAVRPSSAFRLDLYGEEIFVFTPGGDLFRLPRGATVLDFAFAIHSTLGTTCVSATVNGTNVPIRHILKSGDQVKINTSSHQTPKQDWLSFAVTSKARTKIRQLLKEEAGKQVEIARETLFRRMRNRKIELDESRLMQLIKKLKYKTVTDFYVDMAAGKMDVNWVIDRYLEGREAESHAVAGAGEFTLKTPPSGAFGADELIIDRNLTGIDYTPAKCCNPIFGDNIFGFVSSRGIKIHRTGCPNAHDLFTRYGYRILKARWSGKTGASLYTIILRVTGNDRINIISSLMSIISKEAGVQMRSVTIDSSDGLFQGNIAVMLGDTSILDRLMKKLRAVKGIKSVSRLN
ncbi:MAG: HD domain-containing protein [Proteiniphilum sp.]|jgi:GTP pyrophosphokinase|nr:HD domain-containing protein [Proteiniphilum sp.]